MGLTRKQLSIVVILLSGALLVVLNQTLLSPAFPAIMEGLAVDSTTVQWLTSAYSLMEAIVIPLSAYLVGRFPTRRLFVVGIALFAVGSLVALVSPVFAFLLLGRILQAAAAGVVMPMVFTVILLVFPRERRGSAMGIVSLVIGFAPAVGPSISGALVDSVGWRALFAISLALAVIIVIAAALKLENYGDFDPTSFDKPSVALCSLGMLGLLYGLASVTSSSTPAVSLALIVVGVVLLVLFVRRQLKLEVPLLRVQVLQSPRYAINIIVVAAYMAALVGAGVLLPIYLQNLLGVSALQTGLIMLPGAVGGAIMGFFAGRLFDRFGARRVVVPGTILALVGGVGLALFGLDTSVAFIVVVYTCMGVGLQAVIPPLGTWGLNSLDNRVIQHANALTNTINQVGASFGTAILVSLSAAAPSLYPGLSAAEQSMAGIHLSFTCVAVVMFAVFVLAVVKVRESTGAAAAARRKAETLPTKAEDDIAVSLAMNAQPYYVRNTDTIREVAQILAANKTSGVPVVDAGKKVVGFISDGDIMKYIGSNDSAVLDATLMLYRMPDNESFVCRIADLIDMNVMRIATKGAISVRADSLLDDACRVMADKRIKKVPVVDDEGVLVGSLSRSDVIRSTMANIASIEAMAQAKKGK